MCIAVVNAQSYSPVVGTNASQHETHYLVPSENCDVAERIFCATFTFSHSRNFCHRVQLSHNCGSFFAVLALIIFHLGEILWQIGAIEGP